MIFKMSFLNIWRRRARTVIIIVLTLISLSALIFLQGLYDGMVEQTINNVIKSDSGEIVVENKKFRLSGDIKDCIDQPDNIIDKLLVLKDINTVTKRVKIDAMVSTGRRQSGIKIIGLDTGLDINKSILDGNTKIKGSKIAIGRILAKNLNIVKGKKIVLSGQGRNGELVSVAVRVEAVVSASDPVNDKSAVFVDLDYIDKHFSMGRAVTSLNIKLNTDKDLNILKELVRDLIGNDRSITTWEERYPRIQMSRDSLVYFNSISYGVVFFVVGLGILDILLVSVMERIREFGIMLSIGTTYLKISIMIFLESIIMGLLGLFGGVLCGYALLFYFKKVGIDFGYFAEGMEKFGFNSIIYPDIRGEYFIYSFFAVFIACFFASIAPSYYIYKKKPVDMTRC